MASAFNKFNCFVQDLGLAKHNLSTQAIKLAFTDRQPLATDTVFSGISEIVSAGGYPAGGLLCDSVQWLNVAGVSRLFIVDELFTAAGSVPQFQWVVVYNDTAVGKPVLGWYDYGSKCVLASGETFTTDFDPTNGVAAFS